MSSPSLPSMGFRFPEEILRDFCSEPTSAQKEEFLDDNYPDLNNDHNASGVEEHNDQEQQNVLTPVPICSGGEGLPYAPINWPNPGDNWSWRVGRRFSSSGFHVDRFLYLPKNLQKPKHPKHFASKPAVERYIRSEFPDADVDAFFASFNWKIPARDNATSFPPEKPIEAGEEEIKIDIKEEPHTTPRRKRPQIKQETSPLSQTKRSRTSKRKHKKTANAKSAPTKLNRPARAKRSITSAVKDADGTDNFPYFGGEVATGEGNNADFENDENSGVHIYISPQNGILTCDSPGEVVADEFDDYLNCLDDILAQPHHEGSSSQSLSIVSLPEDELARARTRLSSLLNSDFSVLILCDDINELPSLASKIRQDPYLSAEQLVKLKLVEEIPAYGEAFLENKAQLEKADKFFAVLDSNKVKVSSLRKEYTDIKDQVQQLQSEIDSDSLAVQEIDDEIAKLKARRAELTRIIAAKKRDKDEVAYNQKIVAASIPKVVHEIQHANTEYHDWETTKENAVRREAEILAKFAPLKGFYL